MTPICCCGFECGISGNTTHWIALPAGATFDTGLKRSGARSLHISTTAAVCKVGAIPGVFHVSTTRFIERIYVYFETLPDVDTWIITGGSDATGPNILFKHSDSKLYAAVGATLGATGVAVATGQWYRLDYDFNVNTSGNDTCDLQVSGTACGQATATGLSGTITTTTYGIGIAATASLYFDDLVTSDTPGDYPIGGGYVNHFVPTADGTHNVAGANDFERSATGTDITNATTTAYQLIDDVPLKPISGAPADWINLVAPPNATDYVECVYGPAPGISTPTAAPRGVEVLVGYAASATGTCNIRLALNDNGTTDDVFNGNPATTNTFVRYSRKHYVDPPSAAAAWTVVAGNGNFNNVRIRCLTSDAAPDPYFACTMIEAEFAEVVTDLSAPVLTENLKVSEELAARLDPIFVTVAQDAATPADTPVAQLTPLEARPSETALVGDTVTAALMLQASTQEDLKLSETLATLLNPLEARPTEAAKLSESLTLFENPLLATPADAAKPADAITVFVNPELVVVSPENAKPSDTITAGLTPLETLGTENARVSDLVTASRTLEAAPSESLTNISESLTVVENPLITLAIETAAAADLLTQPVLEVAPGGDLAAPELTDTALPADTVLNARLTPLLASAQDVVVVAETVAAAQSLETSAQETALVRDTVTPILNPLITVATDVALVADAVTPLLTPLLATPTFERPLVADTVTPQLTLLQATPTDDVVLAKESLLNASLSLEGKPADQVVLVGESLTLKITPLLADLLTDGVLVRDTATALRLPLAVLVTDGIRPSDEVAAVIGDLAKVVDAERPLVRESIAAELTPLLAVPATEWARVSDTVQASRSLEAAVAEAVLVSDSLTVQVTLLSAVVSESVLVADSPEARLTPLDVALTATANPADLLIDVVVREVTMDVTAQEAAQPADSLSASLVVLQAIVSEGVRCQDVRTAGVRTYQPLGVRMRNLQVRTSRLGNVQISEPLLSELSVIMSTLDVELEPV